MQNIYFENPWILGLSVLILPFLYWYFFKYKRLYIETSFPVHELISKRSGASLLRFLPLAIEVLLFLLLVVMLARPRLSEGTSTGETQGKHYVYVLDISESMKTPFRNHTRLEYARRVLKKTLASAKGLNKYSLVFVAERPFIVVPETYDKHLISEYVRDADKLRLPRSGTALGEGIGLGASLFKEKQGGVLVVLSDGGINRGEIDIRSLASVLQEYEVPVLGIVFGDSLVFDKTQGKYVKTDFSYESLDTLSRVTSGKTWLAEDFRLQEFREFVGKIPSGIMETLPIKQGKDLFPYLGILAIFLVLCYYTLSLLGVRNDLE